MDFKGEKEAFVSGLSGTSIWEIYLILSTSSIGLIVRHVGILCSERVSRWHQNSFLFAIVWEFITVFLPALLCFTVLADFVLVILTTEILIVVILISSTLNRSKSNMSLSEFFNLPFLSNLPFVSTVRTWVNIFTAVAILGVDFQIFPRRFAKAETYGTGIMDVGVGCYILCHGFVSKEGRFSSKMTPKSYFVSLFQCIKKLFPFVLLGLFRLASVRAIDYQHHVSEYGIHWNFFFTIAAVRLMAALLRPLPSLIPFSLPYGTFSILTATTYQFLLSKMGLMDYILYGPDGDYSRRTFISANREGIISCIGYLALYYFGVEVCRCVFGAKMKSIREFSKVVLILLVVYLICILSTLICETMVDRISRRVANLAFSYWIVSVAGIIFVIMFISDLVVLFLIKIRKPLIAPSPYYNTAVTSSSSSSSSSSSTPTNICLVSAIDYNQFTFFLLANLSTGLVNMSVDTIYTGPVMSLIILGGHLVFLSIISILLQKFKIKLV